MPSFSVRVPASSANLGPGFDSLAIALGRWMQVDVELTPGSDAIVDAGSPDLLGGDHLVISGMQATAQRLGATLPGCVLRVQSDIPVARGMGSSAAALVAGIVIAGEVLGTPVADDLAVDIGGQIEGHADNVSASVLGGVTVSMLAPSGYVATRLVDALCWQPVVFIPDSPAFTHEARQILPPSVPMGDAAANIGRAVFLGLALQRERADLVAEAMVDRLHQPYRARIFPHLTPVIAAARAAGALGACLSGAGPTVLALVEAHAVDAVVAAMQQAGHGAGVRGSAVALDIPWGGPRVLRHAPSKAAR